METTGQRIAMICKQKGVGMARLAKRTGLDIKTIENMFYDRHNPTMLTLEKIADVLEVKLGEICLDESGRIMQIEEKSPGYEIRRILREKEMTALQLAQHSGVSYSTVHAIINNKRKAKYTTLYKLAETLDVKIERIYRQN